MSNSTITGGLQLIKPSVLPQAVETCMVTSSNANALFLGDAVQIASAAGGGIIGNVFPAVQIVSKAAASGAIYGVIVGFQPQMSSGNGSLNLSQMYLPASTAGFILIRRAFVDDIYSIMDDGNLASGARGALGITNIGLNANLSVSTAGNTSTGMSNMQLGGASAATTATLQLKIIGVYPNVAANDPTSANARWLVSINNCASSGGTGTVGY